MHCNQNIWSRGNYGIINDRFKMKGQEASSWLNMVTRKMKIVTKILPDTVQYNVSLPQARKKSFHLHLIRMGLLYGPLGLGPGTTCWPGGARNALQAVSYTHLTLPTKRIV